MTTARVLATLLYAVNGAAFLAAGAATLLVDTGLLPGGVRDAVVGFSRGDLGTLHIIQEAGSLLVLVGLLTLWFVFHYDQSRYFHWAMTAYWGIMALIHWFHVAGTPASVVGPLVNTVPFVLFALVGLVRGAEAANTPPEPAAE